MEKMYFNDYDELSDFMYDVASSDSTTICAVLNYEKTVELLRSLFVFDDITIMTIDLSHSDINEYKHDYYVTLTQEMYLFVEPAFINNEVCDCTADVFLFDGDASSRVALNNNGMQFEISVGEDQDSCDCEQCCKREIAADALAVALDVLKYLFKGQI